MHACGLAIDFSSYTKPSILNPPRLKSHGFNVRYPTAQKQILTLQRTFTPILRSVCSLNTTLQVLLNL